MEKLTDKERKLLVIYSEILTNEKTKKLPIQSKVLLASERCGCTVEWARKTCNKEEFVREVHKQAFCSDKLAFADALVLQDDLVNGKDKRLGFEASKEIIKRYFISSEMNPEVDTKYMELRGFLQDVKKEVTNE